MRKHVVAELLSWVHHKLHSNNNMKYFNKRYFLFKYFRPALITLVSFLSIAYAHAQNQRLLKDIYINKSQSLKFGNSLINAVIDVKTGNLLNIGIVGSGDIINTTNAIAVNLEFDGRKVIQPTNTRLVRHTTNKGSAFVSLTAYQLAEGSSDTILTTYILYPAEARIERVLSIHSNTEGTRKFNGFYFSLPQFAIGRNPDCVANVPGPFWPRTLTAANTPYDSLKNKTIRYHTAPDGGFGIFSLTNKQQNKTATVFIKTNGDVHYNTSVYGNGDAITVEQKNNRAVYLKKGQTVTSDTQCLVVTRTFDEGLSHYRRVAGSLMPLAEGTPSWVNEAVILEILPRYFKGGFKEITQKLAFYKDIGFNTIYLMPHWKGGYSPIDLYQIDSGQGSVDDLQQLVKTAHGLGMKVLFDMVIHGFNQKSPIIQQRPEFFYRNERDSFMIHPAWHSVMTDFMNEHYQQYMVDYVLYDQRTFDNDGYRVDAASYKGANWNTKLSYAAYKSGTASPFLMKLMLEAISKKNKEAVLLSEVFGPVFYAVSNFGHDNQTEAMSYVIKEIEKGNYHIAQYKKHLQYVYKSLPKGAVRVFYTRNHDTSWFYEFFGYSPLFMSIEAIHALFGVPEIFAGDSHYKFNPDDDPATYQYYKKLFAARKQFPEFVTGEKLLEEVNCDNDNVFTGMVKDGKHCSIAVVSTSAKQEKVLVSVASRYNKQKAIVTDVIHNEAVNFSRIKEGFSLTLQPYQVLVIRLY